MEKRKLLFSVISLTTGAAIITVLALGATVIGPEREGSTNLGYQPNTSNLYDASFNQETLNGVEAYELNFGKNVKNFIPPTMTPSNEEFLSIFTTAINSGIDVMVANSFTQEPALLGYCNVWAEENLAPLTLEDCEDQGGDWYTGALELYPENLFTLIDSEALIDSVNGLTINFQTTNAGFIAGLAASIEALADYIFNDEANPNSLVVGLWGGMNLTNVHDWMAGYEQGVNFFNFAILGVPVPGMTTPAEAGASVVDTIAELSDDQDKFNETLDLNNKLFPSNPLTTGIQMATIDGNDLLRPDYTGVATTFQENNSPWFVNSFAPTDGEGYSNAFAGKDVSSLFPVAGGQFDAALKAYGDHKVIGVDTDISAVYEGQEDLVDKILGSATKNLAKASELALWYQDRWVNLFDQDLETMWSHESVTDNDKTTYRNHFATGTETFQPSGEPAFVRAGQPWINSDELGPITPPTGEYDPENNDEHLLYGNFELMEYGSKFTGTMQNDGIGFAETDILSDSYQSLITRLNENGLDGNAVLGDSFGALINVGFELNEIIERSSSTFTKVVNVFSLPQLITNPSESPMKNWLMSEEYWDNTVT